MKIVTFKPDNENLIHQAASILFEGFREIWPHICPDIEAARGVVRKALTSDKIGRIALDDNGLALGWIGAVPEYNGHAWCLYPLAVHPDYREQGIGRALVYDLERVVREQGGLHSFLGQMIRSE